MKKKVQKNIDVSAVIVQIQEQLAVLDKKLDVFINKSLTDIAEALAAQKAASAPRPLQPPSVQISPREPVRRQMFAVVCFQCGKDCEIPFKAAPGRPVYCPECFAKRKAGYVPQVKIEPKLPVDVKALKPDAPKTKKKAPTPKKVVKKKTAPKKAKK